MKRVGSGFTIIELIVAMVVVAILAGIVVVGYRSITADSGTASAKADLQNNAAKLTRYMLKNGHYPDSSSAVGLVSSNDATLTYTGGGDVFCLAITPARGGATLSLTEGGAIAERDCVFRWREGVDGKALSAGGGTYGFTCGLGYDSWVYCWGNNDKGQFGNGGTTHTGVPVPVSQGAVPSGVRFSQVSAGSSSVCALATNSKIYCWGDNTYGQLGNGTKVGSLVPVEVAGLGLTFKSVAVGSGSSTVCAVSTGGWSYCWGSGTVGNLGNGTTTESLTPVAMSRGSVPADAKVKKIVRGANHGCLLTTDGWVYCWGGGALSQLGGGVNLMSQTVPTPISRGHIGADETISQIEVGVYRTCAISSLGKLYCWGYSQMNHGAGDGTVVSTNTPVLAAGAGAAPQGTLVKDVGISTSAGGHTCIVARDNSVYCWGGNGYGQLGDGTSVASAVTVQMLGLANQAGAPHVRHVAAGVLHTCALGSDRSVYCWGYGGLSANAGLVGGQLGNNGGGGSQSPVLVVDPPVRKSW